MGDYHANKHLMSQIRLEDELADFYLFIHSVNDRMLDNLQECAPLYDALYVKFELDFSSKLISLASQLRILDEQVKLANEFSCGKLEENHKESDLALRDAFNKIIHANIISKDIFGHTTDDQILLTLEEKAEGGKLILILTNLFSNLSNLLVLQQKSCMKTKTHDILQKYCKSL